MIPVYSYLFVFSFALCALLTWAARGCALRWHFLDKPGARKIHRRPMPMMGGTAILFAFLITVWGHLLGAMLLRQGLISGDFLPSEITRHLDGMLRQLPKLIALSAGAVAVAAVGLYDDKKHLSAKTKFIWQWVAALAVVFLGGIRLQLFMSDPLLTGLVSALWLVALMNAFNLLDNMDGLSSGVALIAAAIFAGIAIATRQYFLASSLLVLCGALGGFLLFNFHPAKIFMGDCGSQLIGYLIGVFTILETFYSPRFPTHFPVLMPLLILAVPLYDTASVILLRLLRRESIFKADKSHFSHRLNALGMSRRGTVLFLYLVSLALGMGAPLLLQADPFAALLIFLQALAVIAVVAILEYYGKRKLEGLRR